MKTTHLRDYQQRAIVEIGTRLKTHKRVVAVAPTGSGKTVIGAAFVAALPSKKRVLWIAHRVELLRQARDGLSAAGVADLGILSGPEKTNVGARVLVASIDTLRSREIPNVDLIVVDEAHRIEAKSYKDVIAARPNALVLGLTATPWRLDGKGLGDTFADMFVVAKPSELFAAGHLARPVVYGTNEDRAREIVRDLKSNKGDFTSRGLGAAMMKVLVGSVVTEWETHARGMQTIVFAAGRDHGRQITRDFVERGHVAEYIDGETSPAERDAVLARLRSKATRIVVNVDVLSEGFDCPAVNCVSLARPTKSRSRFLQYVGRALRPYDGRPVILDHTGNCLRFGAPDADQGWSLDGRASESDGVSPVKHCDACSAMIPIGVTECPICGSALRLTDRDVTHLSHIALEQIRATATCAHCNGPLVGRQIDPNRIMNGRGKYCSIQCHMLAQGRAETCNCLACGEPFRAPPSAKKRYCSSKCFGVGLNKRMSRTCATCGGEFTFKASRARAGVVKYCSRVCFGLRNRVANCA